jgi:hypothetical protein
MKPHVTAITTKMAPKIITKVAESIFGRCLSEEKADVHFKLPISMTDPKVTKVLFLYNTFQYFLCLKFKVNKICTMPFSNIQKLKNAIIILDWHS